MIETVHQNHERKSYRRQLEHDRAVHAAVLRGDTPPEWSPPDEDEEMGDSFSVAGDTTHNHYYSEERGTPSTPPETPQTPSGAPGWATAALIAAGLLGGSGIGAALPWLLGAYDRDPATNTTIREEVGVGVEVVPGGAE